MAEAPTTRPSLLVRLRDLHDRAAWEGFVELYAPLVYGYGRKRGLQDADAADLTQNVLRAVASHIERFDYDARLGSFRGWLFTIVRRQLCDLRARRNGHCQGSGDPAVQRLLESQASPDEESAAWESEYRQSLFARAAEQVRPCVEEATWLAFWQTAVEGKPPGQAAADLGLSVASVYLARSRVMARLRDEVHRQIAEER
jgi:RNA polymerase sigma factor (sigma-70 family)